MTCSATRLASLSLIVLVPAIAVAQGRGGGRGGGAPNVPRPNVAPPIGTDLLNQAFTVRSIGPASSGSVGRVQDVAVDPRTNATWYVVYGSGGVWKTTDHGTTFTPIFDNYGSYSMCCLVIDPRNPDVLWLGTGENLSQRSVNTGDGVYKSTDAGRTWQNVGLQNSEHIGKILIDPRNSDVVYVASQGPLSNPGGDRGLYKTTDGGRNWTPVLQISENTGVTDMVFDPRNADVIYAASWQRRRHTGMVIAGGPETAIYKTIDAGRNWTKLTDGLPPQNKGHIGLAISPQNGDVVYAWMNWGGAGRGGRGGGGGGRGGAPDSTAGAAGGAGAAGAAAGGRGARGGGDGRGAAGGGAPVMGPVGEGFFRSANGGRTWEYRSALDSQEPQYYAETFTDPHVFDRVYVVGTNLSVSDNGGTTFRNTPTHGHVDYHFVWTDPKNPLHMFFGNDGGHHESYDGGTTYRSFTMPTVQFYRLGIDNAWPFYNVSGGAQDNGSELGPSRTRFSNLMQSDWYSIGGGDGMQSRMDPDDPDIWYSATQTSNARFNRMTGEQRSVRPNANNTNPPWNTQAEPARWHWDTQLFPSTQKPGRIYIVGAMVFRSENRGDTWTKISPDLTHKLNRDTIRIMGRIWPDSEAVLRNASTNDLSTGMSFNESVLKPDMLWFGSDDGVVAVTENGGKDWTRFTDFPGVPKYTHVTEVIASRHDMNTAYASFNNYMQGDTKPYLLRTTDKGRTWTSITGDLPTKQPIWNVVEDHVNKNLLFIGTDYGLWYTYDGGQHWVRIKGGLPTIAVRDIEIQRRENDLALGTFGRSFWVLDDYSPLRGLTPEVAASQAALLPMRPHAVQYTPGGYRQNPRGAWSGPNPQYGALVTYYVKETMAGANPNGGDSALVLTITDAKKKPVRMISVPPTAGLHRVAWSLRANPPEPAADAGRGGGGRGAGGRGAAPPAGRGGAPDSAAVGGRGAGGAGAGGAGAGGGGGGGGGGRGGGGGADNGPPVPAGKYTITLQKRVNGKFETMGLPQTVEVIPIDALLKTPNRK